MLNFYRLVLISFFSARLVAQVVPTPTIAMSPSVACTNRSVLFTAISSEPVVSAQWSVFPTKDVTVLAGADGISAWITFPKDLTYTVSVTVSSASGSAFAKKQVAVSRSAVSAFNASLSTAGYPVELVLTNFSSYAQRNAWLFSNESAADSSSSLVKNYQGSGNYSVTLVAFGSRGCNDTSAYSFRIPDSSSVELPNIFTPNRDGVNDIYRPLTRGIRELHAYVYTREGVMIHSWHKVNGFWDGRTTSGEACTEGQYVIVLEAYGFDGRNYKLKGPLTLLR